MTASTRFSAQAMRSCTHGNWQCHHCFTPRGRSVWAVGCQRETLRFCLQVCSSFVASFDSSAVHRNSQLKYILIAEITEVTMHARMDWGAVIAASSADVDDSAGNSIGAMVRRCRAVGDWSSPAGVPGPSGGHRRSSVTTVSHPELSRELQLALPGRSDRRRKAPPILSGGGLQDGVAELLQNTWMDDRQHASPPSPSSGAGRLQLVSVSSCIMGGDAWEPVEESRLSCDSLL